MFPDSKIANQFSLRRDKMSYLIHCGIAPTFHELLMEKGNFCGLFVMSFDEFTNKMAQKQPKVIVIRFYDQESQKVSTRCSIDLQSWTGSRRKSVFNLRNPSRSQFP